MGQTSTTTNKNKKITKQIIFGKYNEQEQKLELSKSNLHSDYLSDNWCNVLKFQNWTTLRTLRLCNVAVTQAIAKSTILVPNF